MGRFFIFFWFTHFACAKSAILAAISIHGENSCRFWSCFFWDPNARKLSQLKSSAKIQKSTHQLRPTLGDFQSTPGAHLGGGVMLSFWLIGWGRLYKWWWWGGRNRWWVVNNGCGVTGGGGVYCISRGVFLQIWSPFPPFFKFFSSVLGSSREKRAFRNSAMGISRTGSETAAPSLDNQCKEASSLHWRALHLVCGPLTT